MVGIVSARVAPGTRRRARRAGARLLPAARGGRAGVGDALRPLAPGPLDRRVRLAALGPLGPRPRRRPLRIRAEALGASFTTEARRHGGDSCSGAGVALVSIRFYFSFPHLRSPDL